MFKITLTLLLVLISSQAFADCNDRAAEAQFISEFKMLSLNPQGCKIVLKNPSLFNPSGVCPLDWSELESAEIKIDLQTCNYIKSHRVISGVAVEHSGEITLEL